MVSTCSELTESNFGNFCRRSLLCLQGRAERAPWTLPRAAPRRKQGPYKERRRAAAASFWQRSGGRGAEQSGAARPGPAAAGWGERPLEGSGKVGRRGGNGAPAGARRVSAARGLAGFVRWLQTSERPAASRVWAGQFQRTVSQVTAVELQEGSTGTAGVVSCAGFAAFVSCLGRSVFFIYVFILIDCDFRQCCCVSELAVCIMFCIYPLMWVLELHRSTA